MDSLTSLSSPSPLVTWVGGHRKIKKIVGSFFPKIIPIQIKKDFLFYVSFRDRHGPSYFLMNGGAANFYRYEEEERSEIIRTMPPQGVFLDIGANIGLFSVYVARLFPQAQVIAFEPHPVNLGCLQKTIQSNRFKNISAYPYCLSDQNKKIELLLNQEDSGGHTADASQSVGSEMKGRIQVEGVTLDSFLFESSHQGKVDRVDVIKIDTQGTEWEVLAGAVEAFRRFKPKVLIELEHKKILDVETRGLKGSLGLLSELKYTVKKVAAQEGFPIAQLGRVAQEGLQKGKLCENYFLERE